MLQFNPSYYALLKSTFRLLSFDAQQLYFIVTTKKVLGAYVRKGAYRQKKKKKKGGGV